MICSLALAKLRTDIKGDLGNNNAVGMAQKLLLFWRKPARRCWWEGVDLDNVEGVEGKLRVWIRRVWTLEMVRLLSSPPYRVFCSANVTSVTAERYRFTLTAVQFVAFFSLLCLFSTNRSWFGDSSNYYDSVLFLYQPAAIRIHTTVFSSRSVSVWAQRRFLDNVCNKHTSNSSSALSARSVLLSSLSTQ